MVYILFSYICKAILLTCLAFGLNLILAATASGFEPASVNDHNLPDQASTVRAQGDPQTRAFVLLTNSNVSQLAQVQAVIIASGGRLIHTFPHQAIIAKIPAGVDQLLVGLPGVIAVQTQHFVRMTTQNRPPKRLTQFSSAAVGQRLSAVNAFEDGFYVRQPAQCECPVIGSASNFGNRLGGTGGIPPNPPWFAPIS